MDRRHSPPLLCLAATLALWNSLASAASAEQVADESDGYTVETVFDGLDRPAGLTMRRWETAEGAHEFFVAEAGRGCVLRVLTSEPPEVSTAIDGFPEGGPRALAMLRRTRILAGLTGGLRNFQLPLDGSVLQADSEPTAGIVNGGQGALDLVAMTPGDGSRVVFAAAGSAEGGLLLSGAVSGNRVKSLQPFGKQEPSVLVSPTGLAMTPTRRPRFLVVADRGGHEPGDSRLHFFKPHNGELALSLPVPLDDVLGIAYSAKGELYALDGAADGGVYRLDEVVVDGRQHCRPARVARVSRPTALVFAPDGKLYVVAEGAERTDESPDASGALLSVGGPF